MFKFKASQSNHSFSSSSAPRHASVLWELDKDFVSADFKNDEGGLCVRVNVLRLENPKYSYMIGWKHAGGYFKPHLNLDTKVDPELLSGLLEQARNYINHSIELIEADKAKRATEIEKQKAEVERQRLEEINRKAQKKKQYESNVEKRRIENRQQRNKGKK